MGLGFQSHPSKRSDDIVAAMNFLNESSIDWEETWNDPESYDWDAILDTTGSLDDGETTRDHGGIFHQDYLNFLVPQHSGIGIMTGSTEIDTSPLGGSSEPEGGQAERRSITALFESTTWPRSDPPHSRYDSKIHRQAPRFGDDLYTAQWIRGEGTERAGWCGICSTFHKMKDSAFWYHMHYSHGAASSLKS